VSNPSPIRAASCLLSTVYDPRLVEQAAAACRRHIGGAPDLVFAFVSSDWRDSLPDFVEALRIHGHATRIAGCSATGLAGVGREIEQASGASLLFLQMKDVTVKRAIVDPASLASSRSEGVWHSDHDSPEPDVRGWIMLGDPLAIDMDLWLCRGNRISPGGPAFGALASGGPDSDGLFLFTEEGVTDAGLIAVSFGGGVRIEGVVSQGCRPIGEPFTITGVRNNDVLTIGQRPAFEVLEETFLSLPPEDRERAHGHVFAGLATNEYVEDFGASDFQVRPIVGGNLQHGALTLGARPRAGQTMQFQVRDRDAADTEMRVRCAEALKRLGKPSAGLLFTGSGRGFRLFGEPDHDTSILRETFGELPLSGMFSNGEVGPSAGRNFVHDHSASAVFFLPPGDAASPVATSETHSG